MPNPDTNFRQQIETLKRKIARGDPQATAELTDLCERYLRIILRRQTRRRDRREKDLVAASENLREMLRHAAILRSPGETATKPAHTHFGPKSQRQQQ